MGSVVVGQEQGALGNVELLGEEGKKLAGCFDSTGNGREIAKQVRDRVFGIESVGGIVYERSFAQERIKLFFFWVPSVSSVRTRMARRNNPS